MCGRFYIEPEGELEALIAQANRSKLASAFADHGKPLQTAGEIAPGMVCAALAMNRSGQEACFPMLWGFQLQQQGKGRWLINARSETAAQKATFWDAFSAHRCAIPASWYFEWEHHSLPSGRERLGTKYAIHPIGQSITITWLAGLYRLEDGLPSFVILTREPAPSIQFIHNRMPVILPESHLDEWINPDSDPHRLLSESVSEVSYTPAEPESQLSFL